MNYYVEYWKSPNKKRNDEVIETINSNLKFFENIFIFSEEEEPRINHKIIISNRITYQFIFDMAIDGINIFCNSDIFFDETINLVKNIDNEEFYLITRYEKNNKLHKYDDPYGGCDSQDTWIWKNKCKIKEANFYIGLPGCDNKIAYFAQKAGYRLKNPAKDIKTYHNHETYSREGTSANLTLRLPPPYTLVCPESI